MKILLRILSCLIFSMICIFIFAGWSGSHVEAKKSIQSKLVADSFYTGAMATPDLQDMGYHSRVIKNIQILWLIVLISGNWIIIKFTSSSAPHNKCSPTLNVPPDIHSGPSPTSSPGQYFPYAWTCLHCGHFSTTIIQKNSAEKVLRCDKCGKTRSCTI